MRRRGRVALSMRGQEDIVTGLEEGDWVESVDAIRGHVAVQGEKFHHLMACLRTAAQ